MQLLRLSSLLLVLLCLTGCANQDRMKEIRRAETKADILTRMTRDDDHKAGTHKPEDVRVGQIWKTMPYYERWHAGYSRVISVEGGTVTFQTLWSKAISKCSIAIYIRNSYIIRDVRKHTLDAE